MSGVDKIKNKVQEAKGEVKEHVGGATGDDSMRTEGKADQTKGSLKQAGENVKDAFKK
ncbi:MAG: CsbD family protein [Actinomycetota bacterium]|nr:CsbD family protein [Actinomycetota bacterium]